MHPTTPSISPGAASPPATRPKITCIMPMCARRETSPQQFASCG